jgi:hypothetical protein
MLHLAAKLAEFLDVAFYHVASNTIHQKPDGWQQRLCFYWGG